MLMAAGRFVFSSLLVAVALFSIGIICSKSLLQCTPTSETTTIENGCRMYSPVRMTRNSSTR